MKFWQFQNYNQNSVALSSFFFLAWLKKKHSKILYMFTEDNLFYTEAQKMIG